MVFVASIDGIIYPKAYTSLKGMCKAIGVSYNSAYKGNRVFIVKNQVIRISNIEIIKIKGTGNPNFKR